METALEFVRTPTKAVGRITPEERAKVEEVRDKWRKIAQRTEPVNPDVAASAIKALYKVCNLEEPRVLVVTSPAVAIVAGTLSVAILHIEKISKHPENDDTPAKTKIALHRAVEAMRVGISLTDEAVANICRAVRDLTGYEPDSRPSKESDKEDIEKIETFFMKCAQRWHYAFQGGNLWIAEAAFLESMRDVIGLTGLPGWKNYAFWEECSRETHVRYVNSALCIVSDFPETIDGDLFTYRDGWKCDLPKPPPMLANALGEKSPENALKKKPCLTEGIQEYVEEYIEDCLQIRPYPELNTEMMDRIRECDGIK